MKTFKARRIRGIVISAVVGIAFVITMLSYQVILQNTAFISGWILLSMMLLLTFYNARKKITYPPFLKSATWLQFHIYIGFLSILVFFIHTQWRLPNGGLESVFYFVFIFLAGSGVVGIYITRSMPKHLAGRGGEVIYERIPIFVRELREQAEALVVESVQFNNSTIIADFYKEKVATYMSAPRRVGLHIFMVDRLRKELQRELEALHRYLNEDEQKIAQQLSDLLVLKDDLDFHNGRQGILKAWLFVHIPLTYSALIFAVVHLVLVHAFYGGLS